MFVKIFTPLRATVLTTLLIAAPAWAQQNSVVFPWNAGYPGGTRTMEPTQDYGQAPTTFPGTPAIAPMTFPATPAIAPTIFPATPTITPTTFPGTPSTFLQSTAPLPLAQFQSPALPYAQAGSEEQEESPGNSGRAWIEIRVPTNAEIWFEGDKTSQMGNQRQFVSPPLDRGRKFTYDVRARWTDGNGKVVDRTQKVSVEADRRSFVDFQTSTSQGAQTNPDRNARPDDKNRLDDNRNRDDKNRIDDNRNKDVKPNTGDNRNKDVKPNTDDNRNRDEKPNKSTKPDEKPLPRG